MGFDLMRDLYTKDNLLIKMDAACIVHCMRRAGNAKSTDLCNDIPKSINALGQAVAGTGHNSFLSGIVVYFDWKINKIIREQLLRYSFINVISSQSLMHCFDKFKEEGIIKKDVAYVDDLSLGFEYWISFQCNYLQLKTIYQQRRSHKRKEWQEFCDALEELPSSNFITYKKEKPLLVQKENTEKLLSDISFHIKNNSIYISKEEITSPHLYKCSEVEYYIIDRTSGDNVFWSENINEIYSYVIKECYIDERLLFELAYESRLL